MLNLNSCQHELTPEKPLTVAPQQFILAFDSRKWQLLPGKAIKVGRYACLFEHEPTHVNHALQCTLTSVLVKIHKHLDLIPYFQGKKKGKEQKKEREPTAFGRLATTKDSKSQQGGRSKVQILPSINVSLFVTSSKSTQVRDVPV